MNVDNQNRARLTENRQTPFQSLKSFVVGIIGRTLANKIAEPYYAARARRRTQRFLAGLPPKDLCVNLGCGYNALPGWINIDWARGPQIQVVWDLSKGFPFPDESCSAVVSEHLIEHLSRENARKFLAECYRALVKGGVLRLSTPDAERFLRSYAGDRTFLDHGSFDRPADTALDRINQMMREDGQHLWAYDEESLSLLLRQIGFSLVRQQKFGESLHPRMQNIDSPEREFESLYVEAIK